MSTIRDGVKHGQMHFIHSFILTFCAQKKTNLQTILRMSQNVGVNYPFNSFCLSRNKLFCNTSVTDTMFLCFFYMGSTDIGKNHYVVPVVCSFFIFHFTCQPETI